MAARARGWILGLAVVGLVAAAASSYVQYQLVTDPAYTSFCDVSETVSCTQLYQSRYGSIAGIPVALGGVFWFGVVLLLAFAEAKGPRTSGENVAAYFLVWSTVGLSVAMYMAYASFFVLGTFCFLCGIVYVAVIGIFLLSGASASTPLLTLPAAVFRDIGVLARRPVGLLVTLVFVGGMAALAWSFPAPKSMAGLPLDLDADAAHNVASPPPSSADERSEFERYWAEQPQVDLDVDTEDADVIVLKFNDFQCPACANTHLAYAPIFQKYASSHPGSVQLVLLDFPLDPSCNDQSPSGPHASGCDAAVAARLAREVGDEVGERMVRWLYSNQETMTADTISAALDEIAGIDRDRMAVQYDDVIQDVRSDIALGATLPVEATPTYIINGVLIKGGLSPEFFDRAIAIELERAASR
jgi:vitamin-K-epoxide reductase (warfarin-sensitive)